MDYTNVLRSTNFQTVSDVFKQLSDSSRLQIFWLLCHCEKCVTDLSDMVEMTSPAVSHHLRILKSSGLVVSSRIGKEVYYKASDSETSTELHHAIEKMMELHCPAAEAEDSDEGISEFMDGESAQSACLADQIAVIRQIHLKLTSDLTRRYTIEELATEYLINATTLKNVFKKVYGLPLATYMKKYRMDTAAGKLKESNLTIAQIASEIGYESQGKFTKAFKDQTGVSPTDYRKK